MRNLICLSTLVFSSPTWRQQLPNTPELHSYLAHLKQLAASRPYTLLAHAYTQHLAILSGGQILKGLIRKTLDLPQNEGTAAFEYPGVSGHVVGIKNGCNVQVEGWVGGRPRQCLKPL
jgi:heme oxygenase